MDNVSISFSGRSGGRVGTSFGGKLPKCHGFESRPDFRSSYFGSLRMRDGFLDVKVRTQTGEINQTTIRSF